MAKKTRNFADVLREQLSRDPALAESVEEERLNAEVAQQILEAREEAGLTQQELADMTGTYQSVIARLEDADYDGHSLKMLQKIATALGKRVGVCFYAPFSYVVSSDVAWTTKWTPTFSNSQ